MDSSGEAEADTEAAGEYEEDGIVEGLRERAVGHGECAKALATTLSCLIHLSLPRILTTSPARIASSSTHITHYGAGGA